MKKILLAIALFLVVFVFVDLADANQETLHWGIASTRDEKIPDPGQRLKEILSSHSGYYIGDTNQKVVYLTFDTGYKDDYTKQILDILDKYNIKGTFFVTGGFMKYNPDLVMRMYKGGHIVGNHTNSHPIITSISNQQLERELQVVETRYKEITGTEMMHFFRPPQGVFSVEKLEFLEDNHYATVFWSLAYIDWVSNRSSDYAYQKITSRIHPGAIVLLHTISKDNAEALEAVIKNLQERGYTFKTVKNLITDNVNGRK